jgi:NADPH2:quinone reductase
MDAIEVSEFGSADVLEVVDKPVPEPDAHEVRIDVEAAGINFADIMQRRGHYTGGPDPRYVPGMEAAGTVDAVGEDAGLQVGDRVVAMLNGGGYAEYATANPQSIFPVPDGMSFEEAAGFPVQYLTAHNCLFGWGGLEDGDRVLLTAAAGGVGTAATQLAARAGAEVFGTASTQAKRDLAADLGCDHPIDYVEQDVAEEVMRRTDGEGVDLALDGIGSETTTKCLDALRDFGRMVTYGAASGKPGSIDTGRLLFENKEVYGYHLGRAMRERPQRVLDAVPDLQEGLQSGELSVIVGESFPLTDAGDAHRYIEDRKSAGKVVLSP